MNPLCFTVSFGQRAASECNSKILALLLSSCCIVMKIVLDIYTKIKFVALQRTLRSYVSAKAEKLEFLLTRTTLAIRRATCQIFCVFLIRKYLIGQKFVGRNFRWTSLLVGRNFRHFSKTSSPSPDKVSPDKVSESRPWDTRVTVSLFPIQVKESQNACIIIFSKQVSDS